MSSPLVSFIIPYFNAGTTIQETIDSIFNQSYSNYDVYIINDGSTDQFSIDKLKEFEGNDKIHLLHQENAGPCVARNNAIKLSEAEFIIPLDADNLICFNSIEKSINFLLNDTSLSAVYGNFLYFGEQNELKKLEPYDKLKGLVYSQIDTCALIRKSIFKDTIEYDISLSKLGLEDWEFWINFHFLGLKSKYIDITFFHLRMSNDSRTFQVANKNLDRIKQIVVEKHNQNVLKEYINLYYQKKMILETPDYRIGNFILRPYRFLKRLFN